MPIPVIDLFAGPGGLGEGFSSVLDADSNRAFKIKISIEMDEHAHQTLELRAFFREFKPGQAPNDFYKYLSGEISRDDLFSRHQAEAQRAKHEAWLAELGAKKTPESLVDERIRTALGSRKSWVLIGGPPCQAYSLVGRSRVIGKEGREKHESDPRQHLYRHYLRILAVHKPPIFVMENVKGLLSAKLKNENVFENIKTDLRCPSKATGIGDPDGLHYDLFPLLPTSGEVSGHFDPNDFVVRCERFGIPQARHRLIILGVRSDWGKKPEMLEEAGTQIPIEDVISDLPRLRSGLSKEPDSAEAWHDAVCSIETAAWLHASNMDQKLRETLIAASHRVSGSLGRGGAFISEITKPASHVKWYSDARLKGTCNHESRGHIRADLHRYFFAAVFARAFKRSPLLEDLPKTLLPKHENVAAALKETKFNDRFRVQVKGRPSTTVVSHISKDGHYFIHYDPSQCRSLTVREAARLQTFPDNYFFEGPRTEQYKQVGNAVPPLLARQIAEIVKSLLE